MDKIEKMLESATKQFRELRLGLAQEVDPKRFSRNSTIPYKIALGREALMYRIVDLGEASCLCFRENNIVSGATLCRAFQETIAVLFYVNRKARKAIKDKDLNHLDESTIRVLLGSKDDSSKPDPVNILTMIDHVEKEVPKFRTIYNKLSEIAHPNWHGTLGIYSLSDNENRKTTFGSNKRLEKITRDQGVSAIAAGLTVLPVIYNDFISFLPQLIQICDNDLEPKGSA